jgi:glycosyltransferase involved in cell wall biosynthesis
MATMAETAPAAQPAETGSLELTILMPCLNEAETLAICIEKAQAFLARTGIAGEVLIADNGSTDGSREIAANLGARVAPVADRGYGAALLGGIAAARGRYIIMGDADDSYDLANLDAFLERLRDGADLVMGNRFRGGIAPGAMPLLHRVLGNPVLSWMACAASAPRAFAVSRSSPAAWSSRPRWSCAPPSRAFASRKCRRR